MLVLQSSAGSISNKRNSPSTVTNSLYTGLCLFVSKAESNGEANAESDVVPASDSGPKKCSLNLACRIQRMAEIPDSSK